MEHTDKYYYLTKQSPWKDSSTRTWHTEIYRFKSHKERAKFTEGHLSIVAVSESSANAAYLAGNSIKVGDGNEWFEFTAKNCPESYGFEHMKNWENWDEAGTIQYNVKR